jgi:hypothetical protein
LRIAHSFVNAHDWVFAEVSAVTLFFRQIRCIAAGSIAVFAFVICAAAQKNDGGGLKTINNPGGGQVVYGPLTNVTSMGDAMGAMLRNVHGHFGDKPQIDKFFRTKGSDSVATFFHLTAKSQDNKPVAGMVIVSLAPGAKEGAAAVLYDDAGRFRKTQPAMMSSLNKAWQQENNQRISQGRAAGSGSGAGGNVGSGPGGVFGVNIEPDQSLSQPLHLATVSDNSASIGLAAGWHISGGGGGQLHAEGPHGESLHMGILNGNNYDPQTPQGANMINYMRRGSTPFTACSMSSDLIADFQCVSTQNRQRQGKAPIQLHVVSSKFDPQNRMEGAFLAETNLGDGNGSMMSSLRLGAKRMGPGNWILTVGMVNVPKNLADQEWPTIQAMIMSYRQNSAVIQQQTTQIINQINARAEANRKLADARAQANYAHNKQVEDNWDVQAKENKAFENYTLDRAVVRDNDIPAHGTFDYPTADWLVKSDPNRFQYVSTQDLLKGIDY